MNALQIISERSQTLPHLRVIALLTCRYFSCLPNSLSSELLSLVRGLVAKPGVGDMGEGAEHTPGRWEAWAEEVAGVVRAWLLRARPLMAAVQGRKALEEKMQWVRATVSREGRLSPRGYVTAQGGSAQGAAIGEMGSLDGSGARDISGSMCDGPFGVNLDNGKNIHSAPSLDKSSVDDFDRVVAALCLLGNHFEGLHLGATVMCKMPSGRSHSGTLADSRSGFAFQGRRAGGVDGTPGVATVIGLALAPALPRDAKHSLTSTSRKRPRVRRNDLAHTLQRAVELARAEVARVIPPGSMTGGVHPLDVNDNLAHATDMSVGLHQAPEAARADSTEHEQRSRQDQLESRDIAAHLATARLRNYFRRRGGWDGPGRLSPDVLIVDPTGGSSSTTRLTEATVGTTPTAVATPAASDSISSPPWHGVDGECDEWVTVASVYEGQGGGGGPHATTVSIDKVTVVPAGIPLALARSLAPHAEEFVPQLKALLEIETEFNGACSTAAIAVVREEWCFVYAARCEWYAVSTQKWVHSPISGPSTPPRVHGCSFVRSLTQFVKVVPLVRFAGTACP